MNILLLVLIVCAALIAIWAAVNPPRAALLWVSVVLLCIVEAMHTVVNAGLIR